MSCCSPSILKYGFWTASLALLPFCLLPALVYVAARKKELQGLLTNQTKLSIILDKMCSNGYNLSRHAQSDQETCCNMFDVVVALLSLKHACCVDRACCLCKVAQRRCRKGDRQQSCTWYMLYIPMAVIRMPGVILPTRCLSTIAVIFCGTSPIGTASCSSCTQQCSCYSHNHITIMCRLSICMMVNKLASKHFFVPQCLLGNN